MSSIDGMLDIWAIFRTLYAGALSGRPYLQADDLVDVAHRRLNLVGDVTLEITIAVSDILMLWRCLVLWNNRKWVVVLPALTSAGTIVCYAVYIIAQRATSVIQRDTEKTMIAAASLNLAFNIQVTFLILLQLIITLRRTSKALPGRKTPLMYTSVASIMIESATPLTIFGICLAIVRGIVLFHHPESLSQRALLAGLSQLFRCLYHSFCALSPQIIIFCVTSGRIRGCVVHSEEGSVKVSRPIHFAHPGTMTEGSGYSSTV
ncbi:hypothetical protein BKA70DRAFT_1446710 [Coprinopsis sp. MPI-PUGE-AT-0042]|nr:hypothetical protein BKA70DRAFT_1446710 [Coprinopsis sp. MPI-PUGE-AT-0042]